VLGHDFAISLEARRIVRLLRRELLERLEIVDLTFELAERVDQRSQARDFLSAISNLPHQLWPAR
jgi:hypothetical protein